MMCYICVLFSIVEERVVCLYCHLDDTTYPMNFHLNKSPSIFTNISAKNDARLLSSLVKTKLLCLEFLLTNSF